MAHIPLIGRLSFKEYIALLVGFSILGIETLLRFTVLLLPKPVVAWFYTRSQVLFDRFASAQGTQTTEEAFASAIRSAKDFGELVALYGYAHEEHVVLTKDGYLLTLHRIPRRKGGHCALLRGRHEETSRVSPPRVAHEQAGYVLDLCVRLVLTSCAPPVRSAGFDVWLGNNRGNKYSKKSIHHGPSSSKFWNYSLDEFAWYDIPDSIEYILARTGAGSLGYVGFSQGTAQAFACVECQPAVERKSKRSGGTCACDEPCWIGYPYCGCTHEGVVSQFSRLSHPPPSHCSVSKCGSPTSVYLFFGRKAILSSVATWQAIIYPPIFTSIIDTALYFLFSWDSRNITTTQKTAAYAHLYSYASVKSVVHWFQIMRESTFQMFDDDVAVFGGPANSGKAYRPARFPTRNIETPILLLYGNRDSLMDIEAMVSALPASGTRAKKLEGYEHLDVLWGKDIDKDVFPEVVNALRMHCEGPAGAMRNGVKVFEMGADSKEPEE
ncbi:Alpha/Beta hydrolase protein [Boletus reticuloceps]|uniref:Alpha/Beta hydrolase protein n=1 Tax=Boletus reticuloceps TaxID=495285 RepID=A0A8I2Z176_9AGAM|nr:Alpha/Beta hydrolase protein [Boletus reticuloceps]